jgi:hypothetical protein
MHNDIIATNFVEYLRKFEATLYPKRLKKSVTCVVGWVDIGTMTKVPLKFVTYLSKITKKVF